MSLLTNDLVPYKTEEGERWDTIADKAYGNSGLTKPIISANPSVPISGRLPGGITLYLPVLDQDNSVQLPIESTPPWRS